MNKLRATAIVFVILAAVSIGYRTPARAAQSSGNVALQGYYPMVGFGTGASGAVIPLQASSDGKLMLVAGAGAGATPASLRGYYPAVLYGVFNGAPVAVSVNSTGAMLTSAAPGGCGDPTAICTSKEFDTADGVSKLGPGVGGGGYDFATRYMTINGVDGNSSRMNFTASTVGTVASGASITFPTNALIHVTGTATISTIAAAAGIGGPYTGACEDIIADGAFVWNTSGNIATTGGTAVVNSLYRFCYDSGTAKWYIK